MLDMSKLLQQLAKERPIFHSEADFQHALAWVVRERLHGCSIRLERKPPGFQQRGGTDIWVTFKGESAAVELKYKKKKLSVTLDGEAFDLSNQESQDTGRYDFLADISRIEQLVYAGACSEGHAVLLTNDSSYWRKPKGNYGRAVDAMFRLHDEQTIKGQLSWSDSASEGTLGKRAVTICINGGYTLAWRDYSGLSGTPNSVFKYLAVEVRKPSEKMK